MTITNCIDLIVSRLSTLYDAGEAGSIAKLVLEHYTGINHAQLKSKGEIALNAIQSAQVTQAIQQLLQHEPVQYVLGEAWFAGMRFIVNENVLIPRPETEELVNWIAEENRSVKPLKILEIGTGSGCIAITLKKKIPQAEITAIDVSEGALATARQNAKILGAEVDFLQADFLNERSWPQLGRFDLIVSNPPYIPAEEKERLAKNVTDWEPATALFVPDNDALLFYKKIAAFGKLHLKSGGSVYVECHQEYASATMQLFEKEGYPAQVKKDIFDNERMLKAVPAL